MDTDQLQAFVAVAESGSFSRAAQRLHLTQPAVSKRVAQLEARLGARLLDRVGRRVATTRAGEALLPRARRILDEIADTRQAIRQLSGRVAGRLGIATSHHIGLHRLPPVLRAYRSRYPEVALDLRFMSSEAAWQAVLQGELELAVATFPEASPPLLQLLPVWSDPLAAVVAEDDPLAGAPSVGPADLAARPAIFPTPDTATRKLIDRRLAALDMRPEVLMQTNYLETIKMLVCVGLGWSILPERMTGGGVRSLSLPGLAARRRLGALTHRRREPSPAAAAFLEALSADADPALGRDTGISPRG